MLYRWDSGSIVYFIYYPKEYQNTHIKAILIYHKYLLQSGLD